MSAAPLTRGGEIHEGDAVLHPVEQESAGRFIAVLGRGQDDAVAGERLMHKTSKPRRPHGDEDPAGIYWFEDDDRLRQLYDYCRQDVEVERELFDRLPPLSATEQTLWALSCRINERGFCVDRQFAEAARLIAQTAAPEIEAELAEITSGAITGIDQVARLLQWLQQQGCTAQKLDRRAAA